MAITRPLRRSLGLGVVAAALWATPASADDGVEITVTPSTGLRDGQTVVVEGTGFPSSSSGDTGLLLCPQGTFSWEECAELAAPFVGTDNRFREEVVVRREQPAMESDTPVRCGNAPEDCRIVVLTASHFGGGLGYDAVAISFSSK